MTTNAAPAALAPYRVLDLTEEIGQYCGRAFAEMGADVIKIEPPQGDPVRRVGPFYHDDPQPGHSLLWFALNASKRGVTLNLEHPDGRRLFDRLAATADLVIESYAPGYLAGIGIDHAAIRKANPKLVWTSITGFGQDGPYQRYKWCDLVGLALGGLLNLWGEPGRPPVRSRASQAYYHASMAAATGAMAALYCARRTGAGQHVDASMQEIETFTLSGPGGISNFWPMEGRNITRSGGFINLGALQSQIFYPCKDGYVAVGTLFGPHFPTLIELMTADGAAEFLAEPKWASATRFQPMPGQWQVNQEEADAAEGVLARWLLLNTKAKIMQMALDHELLIFPVLDPPENLPSPQLKARGYFQEVAHSELGATITYPGPPVRLSATPWQMRRRAPLLREHNAEVYAEIGVSGDELATLSAAGVI